MKKVLGIVAGFFALAGLALFFILPGWYIAGAIFFGLVIIIAIVNAIKEKFETKCSKCKKPYDYEDDVEWRLIKRGVKGASSSNSSTLVSTYFVYDITCHCSDCGRKKKYRKKIMGPSINDKGELNIVDPEEVLEENFNQDKEVTWGAIFACVLMGLIFTVGGLFLGGCFGDLGIGNLVDFDVPGITQTELGEDPEDYYGTYYSISDDSLVTIIIDADKCTVIEDNGIKVETNTYDYDYASAEYVAARLPSAKVSPSLLLYPSSDRSQAIVWAAKKTENGYEFTSAAGMSAKTEVLTFEDVTNDPKDYYGTYRLDSFYVILNEDGTAKIDLGNGEIESTYFYANNSYVSRWFGENYNAAIIVDMGEGNAYIFNYESNTLTLSDQYTFTK